MGFPIIVNSKETTEDKIGGDAMNNINRYLSDIDISIGDPTKKPLIRTPTTFRSGKLSFRSSDGEHDLTINVPNMPSDSSINLIPSGGVDSGDEPLYRTKVQEVEGKVISAQSNTITDLDDENFAEDASISWDKINAPSGFTPAAHAASHENGGSDELEIDWSQLASVPSTFTPSAHNTSHQQGGSDELTIDWSQLDNVPSTFTPSAHDHDSDYAALSHNHSWADITSGSPPKLDDLSAPDDNTDLNASTDKHGLLKKLSGVSTQYLNGEGNWTTPAGGEGGGSTSLAGLTDDVDIDTPTDGQILEYSDVDSKWHNVENTGGSGAEELNDLTDVTVTTPTDGDILEYDTDGFVNVAHDHSGEFSALGHNHDSAYSAITHDHDSDYSDINHNHDTDYAAISHNHSAADITSGTLAVGRGGTGKTTFTQHALLKGGASNAYEEIAVGSNNQVLAVVSGTPAWKTLDNETIGFSQANGNASTTAFEITHGMGSEPTYAFVSVMSPAIGYSWTKDATKITVTFTSAPDSGTNNVKIMWRAVA